MGDMAKHNAGVGLCADWLRTERGCNPVITEAPFTFEGKPYRLDAIGFTAGGPSILVDWKESFDDARQHFDKRYMLDPKSSPGQLRYIASPAYVVEWESFGPLWPSYMGVLWWDGFRFREQREAEQVGWFNVFAEREILRAYAAKANYAQRGAVQRQTWLDRARDLIAVQGPTTAAEVVAACETGLTAHKVAKAMERDGRFIQVGGAGGAFDVIRKEASHEVAAG